MEVELPWRNGRDIVALFWILVFVVFELPPAVRARPAARVLFPSQRTLAPGEKQ